MLTVYRRLSDGKYLPMRAHHTSLRNLLFFDLCCFLKQDLAMEHQLVRNTQDIVTPASYMLELLIGVPTMPRS